MCSLMSYVYVIIFVENCNLNRLCIYVVFYILVRIEEFKFKGFCFNFKVLFWLYSIIKIMLGLYGWFVVLMLWRRFGGGVDYN